MIKKYADVLDSLLATVRTPGSSHLRSKIRSQIGDSKLSGENIAQSQKSSKGLM